MKVTFRGVRGSLPTPAQATDSLWRLEKILDSALRIGLDDEKAVKKFIGELPPCLLRPIGGNTPCVEVRHGDDLIVLDAGSGLRQLGLELNSEDNGPRLTLLISHTHWDHLQGFPFFTPAYNPAVSIAIYGRRAGELSEAFGRQQTAPLMFPIALSDMGAEISFHTFPAEGLAVGGLTVEALPLPHPGGSLAFRISAEGRSVVYATDYEFASTDGEEAGQFVDFIKNAALLISDTQYTHLEGESREGWGHSTSFEAMDLAMRGGVSAFYMFHHDPGHSDAKLFDNLEKTRAYHAAMSGQAPMAIELAAEGLTVDV